MTHEYERRQKVLANENLTFSNIHVYFQPRVQIHPGLNSTLPMIKAL